MEYITIFLSLGSALVGSIIGGVMTMLATLLANWLQLQSEKRKEKRERNISRVENMRNYLSQTVALAAQIPLLEEFEDNNPLEGKRTLMRLWFEDIYPLRTLFYENTKIQKNSMILIKYSTRFFQKNRN